MPHLSRFRGSSNSFTMLFEVFSSSSNCKANKVQTVAANFLKFQRRAGRTAWGLWGKPTAPSPPKKTISTSNIIISPMFSCIGCISTFNWSTRPVSLKTQSFAHFVVCLVANLVVSFVASILGSRFGRSGLCSYIVDLSFYDCLKNKKVLFKWNIPSRRSLHFQIPGRVGSFLSCWMS